MPPVDLGELSEVESLGCGDAIITLHVIIYLFNGNGNNYDSS